ncbi:MAG: hypothetical protein M3445_02995, partial [Actinomycetota bacterium]|nr:hypothetical protein [Actinomycetota bacterium]
HTSWAGELPVGKGAIRITDDEAVLDGQFFMDTTHGHDTFLTVKALSEGDSLQQWSYSLDNVTSEPVEVNGEKARGLIKIHVDEVSPVLKGASINTRTLGTKAAKQTAAAVARLLTDAGRERWSDDDTYVWLDDWDVDDSWAVFDVTPTDEAARLVRVDFTRDGDTVELGDTEAEVQRTVNYAPKGAKFVEQATSVLADVDSLTSRAAEVVALRAAKGKSLAVESADVLARLKASLAKLTELVESEPTPPTTDEITREFLRSVAPAQGATP